MARILLIDDDNLLRRTLCQMLALDGHQVHEAASGDDALRQMQTGLVTDLVITDMLMPGLDGAQVIVSLRRLQPSVPVIAISGGRRSVSSEFSLDTAGLVGASHTLPKPFGRAALQSAVRAALAG